MRTWGEDGCLHAKERGLGKNQPCLDLGCQPPGLGERLWLKRAPPETLYYKQPQESHTPALDSEVTVGLDLCRSFWLFYWPLACSKPPPVVLDGCSGPSAPTASGLSSTISALSPRLAPSPSSGPPVVPTALSSDPCFPLFQFLPGHQHPPPESPP